MRAFQLASDANVEIENLPPYSPQKLYFQTWPRGVFKAIVNGIQFVGIKIPKFGRNRDIDIASLLTDDFPIHAAIDVTKVRKAKRAAVACHSSQLEGGDGITSMVMSVFDRTETYMRAIPTEPPQKKESDLFEGIHPGD